LDRSLQLRGERKMLAKLGFQGDLHGFILEESGWALRHQCPKRRNDCKTYFG